MNIFSNPCELNWIHIKNLSRFKQSWAALFLTYVHVRLKPCRHSVSKLFSWCPACIHQRNHSLNHGWFWVLRDVWTYNMQSMLSRLTLVLDPPNKNQPVQRGVRNTSRYYFVLKKVCRVLPRTPLYYKACTRCFPALKRTIKVAQNTLQYYFVLRSLRKALSSTTSYYKGCTAYFQDYFVPQSLRKVLPSTTSYFTGWQSTSQYFVLQRLCRSLPTTICSAKVAQSRCFQYYFVQYWKVLHKILPVLLCTTTKIAQRTLQHFFVLQDLHTQQYFPVLLCTANAAQNYHWNISQSLAFNHSSLDCLLRAKKTTQNQGRGVSCFHV